MLGVVLCRKHDIWRYCSTTVGIKSIPLLYGPSHTGYSSPANLTNDAASTTASWHCIIINNVENWLHGQSPPLYYWASGTWNVAPKQLSDRRLNNIVCCDTHHGGNFTRLRKGSARISYLIYLLKLYININYWCFWYLKSYPNS